MNRPTEQQAAPQAEAKGLTDDDIDSAQEATDCFMCDCCDSRMHDFAREIERRVLAATPLPAQVQPAERYCNKCGYFGPDEIHQRPNGTGECGYLSSPTRQVQPAEQVGGWRHKANEWADMATNGIQWLRNVRDGISTPEEALVEMEANHDRIQALATPAPQPVRAEARDALRYRWLRERNSVLDDSGIFTAIRVTRPDGAFDHNDLIALEEMDAAIDAAMSPQQAEQGKGADRG